MTILSCTKGANDARVYFKVIWTTKPHLTSLSVKWCSNVHTAAWFCMPITNTLLGTFSTILTSFTLILTSMTSPLVDKTHLNSDCVLRLKTIPLRVSSVDLHQKQEQTTMSTCQLVSRVLYLVVLDTCAIL